MSEVEERLRFRKTLIEASKDEYGFITPSNLLSEVMPSLLDAKLVDSEEYEEAYYFKEEMQLNGYMINGSGERLQLFIVDERFMGESIESEKLYISQKAEYEKQFKRVERLVKKAFVGKLFDSLQDSSQLKVLASHLESLEGIERFDVIEIFLISLSLSVSFRGKSVQPNKMYFKEHKITRTYQKEGDKKSKELLILKQVIDLGFLFDVMLSKGHRETLTIEFKKTFNYPIEAIKAADEEKFESYLCVLNADILANLYKQYSSRLLEKNVRSFLDFRGVNKGIKETIRKEPEKFIAYNNGLTITATKIKTFERKKKLYIEALSDFQIVNGGQTTATIYFSQKEGLDVSKVKVMAKINVAKQTNEKELDALINNISEYSNAQSKVSKVDLRSRNPQLIKIKQLSQSVITPSGAKWFFERSKGEYATMMRKAGSSKARIKKEYPTSRKFTKEQMAKYVSAWGDEPYMVKKGGERIFRHFIEKISPEDSSKAPNIDRDYYEDIVSKIILFKGMEKLHGTGKNAIGQIRSAVIPYSLSVLFDYTNKRGHNFLMSKIWKQEGIEEALGNFLLELMLLMNGLIKKYSPSDDYGEYSKRVELWNSIKKSDEIKAFMSREDSLKVLKKYSE